MKRGNLALMVTVLLAVAAAGLVFLYVSNVKHSAQTGGGLISVIVSKQDIPANTSLDALVQNGTFTTKSIPKDDVVQTAVTDTYQLQGQTSAYPIVAGEQIPAARLQGKLQAPGGVLGIPKGDQALALSLDGERLVNGVLQKGDHVTIYGTLDTNNGNSATRTLVPDALVLMTNTAGGVVSGGATTITLALNPHDTELVIYAQEQGAIYLSLLPPNEAGVRQPPITSATAR
jgi:pilus assembly protein CpaB